MGMERVEEMISITCRNCGSVVCGSHEMDRHWSACLAAKEARDGPMYEGMMEMQHRERALEFLVAIDGHIQDIGYPPTVKELQRDFAISTPSLVIYHLRRMEYDGLITRVFRHPRTIVLTEKGKAAVAKAGFEGER